MQEWQRPKLDNKRSRERCGDKFDTPRRWSCGVRSKHCLLKTVMRRMTFTLYSVSKQLLPKSEILLYYLLVMVTMSVTYWSFSTKEQLVHVWKRDIQLLEKSSQSWANAAIVKLWRHDRCSWSVVGARLISIVLANAMWQLGLSIGGNVETMSMQTPNKQYQCHVDRCTRFLIYFPHVELDSYVNSWQLWCTDTWFQTGAPTSNICISLFNPSDVTCSFDGRECNTW